MDSRYFQNKRKSEVSKEEKYKGSNKDYSDVIIIAITILFFVISLFIWQWFALQSGREKCESIGGNWHSSQAGKVAITKCEGGNVND